MTEDMTKTVKDITAEVYGEESMFVWRCAPPMHIFPCIHATRCQCGQSWRACPACVEAAHGRAELRDENGGR